MVCCRGACPTELILNRFDTRLGRRMSRFFGSMFPPVPDLRGRRIITFHNQRDFIFVRQHRYMPDSREARGNPLCTRERAPRFGSVGCG
jgi:ribosome production factor 1